MCVSTAVVLTAVDELELRAADTGDAAGISAGSGARIEARDS
ncbi:hypothetical protein [Kribbella sp. VKM Ac-2566]|nr:hypothetical protein [Kribbella sp. VKM Ac-2566]